MSLDGLLQCPRCGADLRLEGNCPVCAGCGYRVAELSPPSEGEAPQLLHTAPAFALELARGYGVTRSFLHLCVKRYVRPTGVVLDIGSGRRPSYLRYLRTEEFTYLRADANPALEPHLLLDLEQTLPLKDGSLDAVLLFNVLEHIYDFEGALREICRVLRPGGTLYLLVPYLIKIHGSPCDYFRYTHYALGRMLPEAGFDRLEFVSDGGLFKFLPTLFKWTAKLRLGYLLYPFHLLCCGADELLGWVTGGRFQRSLPLGYFVRCTKR